MSDAKKTENQEVQFPLNAKLLEESAKIKEERRILKDRLKKIEASKGQVSATVYEKVCGDYKDKLDENTDRLLEKKQDIDRELSSLYDAKSKVGENVSKHRESLEEIKFRQSLGEFSKNEFNKLADEQNEKLGKFEKILAAIESNIHQYESLFGDEEEFASDTNAETEAPPFPPPPDPDTGAQTGKAPNDYDVGKGDGYFGSDTEDVPLTEDMQDKTSKEIELPAQTGECPTLTIIEGDNKGKVYDLTLDEFTLGRSSSNFVVLKEAKVSRQHASVKRQGKEFLLEDLHSSNGVIVNDEKIKEHVLADGDIIRIGDFLLKFSA